MEQKEDNIIGNYKALILGVVIFLAFITILVWLIPSLSDDSLINSFFYFFSASAQTMGALVAIVLTASFSIMFSLKTIDIPYSEPIRRLFLKDKHLIQAIYLSLGSIIVSIFGVLISKGISSCILFFIIVILLIIIVLITGVLGISELIYLGLANLTTTR
jgi:hypothetical protein